MVLTLDKLAGLADEVCTDAHTSIQKLMSKTSIYLLWLQTIIKDQFTTMQLPEISTNLPWNIINKMVVGNSMQEYTFTTSFAAK